jgi:hypothetical protein
MSAELENKLEQLKVEESQPEVKAAKPKKEKKAAAGGAFPLEVC